MNRVYHILTLTLLLSCWITPSYGQNIDSLKLEYIKTKTTDKPASLRLLKQIAAAYQYVNFDSTLFYSQLLIAEATKVDSKIDLAKGYNSLADFFNINGQYAEALEPLEKSLELCRELGSKKGETVGLFLKGNILQNLHQYKNAEDNYMKSLALARAEKDSTMIGRNFQNLGINHEYLTDFDKAVEYFFKAIAIYTGLDNQRQLAQVYTLLGDIYTDYFDEVKSVEYYNKAITIKKRLGSLSGLAMTYHNLGLRYMTSSELEQAAVLLDSAMYYANLSRSGEIMRYIYFSKGSLLDKQKNYEMSLKSYEEGLASSIAVNDPYKIAIAQEGIGRALVKLGKFKEAEKYLAKALEYTKSISAMQFERSVRLELVQALEGLGEYEKANESYKKMLMLKDSIFSSESQATITEIETKYQTQQKEIENKLLKNEKETQAETIARQRISLFASIGGIALMGLIAFLLFKQSKERKRNNLLLSDKSSKIETLHKELSHRVKNNLAFVSSLMRMQVRRLESEEARQAVKEGETRIAAMSLLHRKLYMETEETAVDIKNYLEELGENLQDTYPAEGIRPKIKFDINNIKTNGEAAVRIGLIINELITNSFKYAFAKQENPTINIKLEKTIEKEYRLIYQDNGVGLPAELKIGELKSLGLKLIHMLTKQLEGTVETKESEGAYFQFDFNERKISV